MALSDFKNFVKQNPKLLEYVRNKEASWQQFYEMYDLYGSKSDVWNKYLNISSSGVNSFKTIFDSLKNINMEELQSSISSLQKGIGYVKDLLVTKDARSEEKKEYEPRPIHKYFDD